MGLSAKERLFVNEFIRTSNVTKAAKAAGCSAKSAAQAGSRMYKRVNVKAAIDARLEKAADKAELKAADVLAEMRKLAFANLKGAFAEDGSLLPMHEMPDDVAAALIGVETDEIFGGRGRKKVKVGYTRKVKLIDKVRALEMLGKHFKLFTDTVEHTGKDGGPMVMLTMPANGSEAVETEQPEQTAEEGNGAAGP